MKNCKTCHKPFRDIKRNGISISKFCPECRKEKEQTKKAKHEQTKGFQESERKRLHRKAWTLMSRCVRERATDWKGMVTCYTCGVVKPISEIQAGHFWHDKLDFDPENIRPQCCQCNTYKSGSLGLYAAGLIRELGSDKFMALSKRAHDFRGYSTEDLKEIIKKLQVGCFR